jgi:hypothetical protein
MSLALQGALNALAGTTGLGGPAAAAAAAERMSGFEPFTGVAGDLVESGEETLDRLLLTGNLALTSGALDLSYFTVRKSEDVTRILSVTRGTAASGLTLARMGLYAVADDESLTLLGGTVNDTSLWAGTFTEYVRTIPTSGKTRGRRYAVGLLAVGTTMPTLYGAGLNGAIATTAPRLTARLPSQTNLPATIAADIVSSSGHFYYAEVRP